MFRIARSRNNNDPSHANSQVLWVNLPLLYWTKWCRRQVKAEMFVYSASQSLFIEGNKRHWIMGSLYFFAYLLLSLYLFSHAQNESIHVEEDSSIIQKGARSKAFSPVPLHFLVLWGLLSSPHKFDLMLVPLKTFVTHSTYYS